MRSSSIVVRVSRSIGSPAQPHPTPRTPHEAVQINPAGSAVSRHSNSDPQSLSTPPSPSFRQCVSRGPRSCLQLLARCDWRCLGRLTWIRLRAALAAAVRMGDKLAEPTRTHPVGRLAVSKLLRSAVPSAFT
jgi:hypothetical protein